MSYRFEADFGGRILTGYASNMRGKEFERSMCHQFSTRNDSLSDSRCIVLVPGQQITKEGLYGPASTMDRSVIYPCSRYRCRLPCPCSTCQHLPCSNEEQLQDHQKFHIVFHTNCKYCQQLIHIFPKFNFFFLNRQKQKKRNGYCAVRLHRTQSS